MNNKTRNLIFVFFIVALITFSACGSKTNGVNGDGANLATAEIVSEADSLSADLNETEQLDKDLSSPDLDLDINF